MTICCVFRASWASGGEDEVSDGEGAGSDCPGGEVGRAVWCEVRHGWVNTYICMCVRT